MNNIFDEFFTGINYWASKNAIRMWEDFDAQSVENDMKLLHDAKITHLRVFPLWSTFQPLTAECSYSGAYEYRFGNNPLPDTEAGRAGVSEEACAHFEEFCHIARKYDMKLIVGLMTGHMSFGIFAPPAFSGRSHMTDADDIKWQVRFVSYFVNRFKEEPSIIGWDLGNEVLGLSGKASPDRFFVWCSLIANTIRSCDNTRPVISGMGDPGAKNFIENGKESIKELCEICDIHTFHPYQVFSNSCEPLCSMKPVLDPSFKCQLGEDIGKKPDFVQEFGSIGYLNCSYKSEARFYRAALLSGLAHGNHGLMWWCAFDQGELDFPPYDWNNRGSDYGFFTRDGKAKPIVAENLAFHDRLKKIPGGNLPKHTVNGVIIVPRDDSGANLNTLRAAYILGKQANLDLGFTYALDPIPDAPLYIMPSLDSSMAIPKRRLDVLLEKVKKGAVLYISIGNAFFRSVPELFGVTFEARQDGQCSKTLVVNGEELPVTADAVFTVESVEAEVIGRDEDGVPMFFKNKYGQGSIYFLTAPVEKYLAAQRGAFYLDGQPDYAMVYREIAQAAGVKRLAESSDPLVRLTEHKIADGEYYVFAINYSNNDRCTNIVFDRDVDVTTVFGAELTGGKAMIPACDGALYKITEKRIIDDL